MWHDSGSSNSPLLPAFPPAKNVCVTLLRKIIDLNDDVTDNVIFYLFLTLTITRNWVNLTSKSSISRKLLRTHSPSRSVFVNHNNYRLQKRNNHCHRTVVVFRINTGTLAPKKKRSRVSAAQRRLTTVTARATAAHKVWRRTDSRSAGDAPGLSSHWRGAMFSFWIGSFHASSWSHGICNRRALST